MGTQRNDLNDEWSGLDPRQPGNRWGCILGLLFLLIILLVACGAAGYLLWGRLSANFANDPILSIPTPIAATAVTQFPQATPETDTATPPPSQLTLVPTVTLASTEFSGGVEVNRVSGQPRIDSDLNEWADLPLTESSYLVFNLSSWDGSDDVRASWRLGWDDDNLYVAVVVEDDVHVQTQVGNQTWRGDGISLQIDTQRTADFGPGLNRDDFQINLSPGDFVGVPPVAFRSRGSNSGQLIDDPGHRIAIAAQPVGQGYHLEAAIPWSNLAVTPAPGLILGIALNVNDNDTPGTAAQEVMKSHIATRQFKDPTSWGEIILR